jgi:hypothetical protein
MSRHENRPQVDDFPMSFPPGPARAVTAAVGSGLSPIGDKFSITLFAP